MDPMIPVAYTPLQVAANPGSFSPSASKPAIVASALLSHGFPVRFVAPRPLLFWEFARVHDPDHVSAILTGRKPNGFGSCDMGVARSLPYTSGSMLQAALEARPGMPAASLSSGFHHAGHGYSSGFCTLNGLMVAAASLLERGSHRRVAILDCDAHYGDGTDDILRHHRKDLAGSIIHRTMGRTGTSGSAYLLRLRAFIHDVLAFEPDVVLYQAGADPHVDDPLGGRITTSEMLERDRMVFEAFRDAGIPVAWNLAGGYQRGGSSGIDPVLGLHLNTFTAAARAYGLEAPMTNLAPSSGASRERRRRLTS